MPESTFLPKIWIFTESGGGGLNLFHFKGAKFERCIEKGMHLHKWFQPFSILYYKHKKYAPNLIKYVVGGRMTLTLVIRGRSQTTYVDKRRWVNSPKMSTFGNKKENVNVWGRLVKKDKKIVNVVCERPMYSFIHI